MQKNFLSTTVRKPETTAFLVFLAFAILLRLWGEPVVSHLLEGASDDLVFLSRLKMTILALITALFALATYLVLTKYNIHKASHTLAEEMVSDLMLSREQFRMLYDSSPVPYFLIDDFGNLRNPNKAMLRFMGGTVQECERANFYDLLNSGRQGEQGTALIKAKVDHVVPVAKEEVQIRTLTNTHRWAQVSIFSLEKQSQIPFKHLVTLIDITQEKQSEEVKTDFLLLASHQLRTPATTIKWYVDYLLTNEALGVTGVVREYLEEIYAGNERMINLVTTLLTVSRIEMGTLAPEYKATHVNDLVQDILAELATDIKKREQVVEVHTEGDDKLITDGTMIRIALHNLLTNAVKYTPKGGTVTVETLYDINNCRLSVTDTGYGIPLEEQEKVFTKMFRASNARKVSANGTGLGLHLTKAFVEKLGGTIEFTSHTDQGTRFTILLPRVAPEA